MKIIDEEIRYPEKGDKFFNDSGIPNETAWLNKAFQEFGNYADAYQTGAICLLDSALENKDLRDYNIYPAIFLIRHYIELRLKELIQGINFCNNQNKGFSQGHNIETLWRLFKDLYSSLTEKSKNEIFKTMDDLISEISNHDSTSTSFRYPVDKRGQKTQRLEYVNLTILRETFIRVCFVFDGVAFEIGQNVDNTDDMLQSIYRY